ncbi:hypothetical protein AAVH_36155 [Aphelenchoides avenae]|nr:hypothetical protein AAVH_36155 [Aphelenchus avenae]
MFILAPVLILLSSFNGVERAEAFGEQYVPVALEPANETQPELRSIVHAGNETDEIVVTLRKSDNKYSKRLGFALVEPDARLEFVATYSGECANTGTNVTGFLFGERMLGMWKPYNYFRVVMLDGHGDPTVSYRAGEEVEVSLSSNETDLTIRCGDDHNSVAPIRLDRHALHNGTTILLPKFMVDTLTGCPGVVVTLSVSNAKLWYAPPNEEFLLADDPGASSLEASDTDF